MNLVAIPVVIAFTGFLIQNSVAMMQVQQRYVELAINVLTMPAGQVDPELREWAAEVLRAHSPIPLAPVLVQRLKSGEIVLRMCSNECAYFGQIRWLGDYHYQICGNYDSDSCLEWSHPIYSPQGRPSETP